jgi:GNAT superfamily N-acetyltransferase
VKAGALHILIGLMVGCARQPMTQDSGSIRSATVGDVGAIERLAEMKRAQYAEYQPRMWKPAVGASEKHSAYLVNQIEAGKVIALVHERAGKIDGFVIAEVRPAPPVYDPGGLTCTVDDFMVERDDWDGVGAALLDQAIGLSKARGASQVIVVCGRRDEAKRAMLKKRGLSVASEWYTKGN